MTTISSGLLLPDTNILVHAARQSSLYQWIHVNYSLSPNDPAPILSIVTVGEIRCLAKRNQWGQAREQRISNFLARSRVLPLEYPGIIDAYVDIDERSRKVGRTMGDHDMWIAATARVLGATLLTTDKDFDHLSPGYIQREWIDPASP